MTTETEKAIGFSRVKKIGNFISVAGTAAIAKNGKTSCPGDVLGQFHRCMEIIQKALSEKGASLKDVIRTRILFTDISNWGEIADAHAEYFKDICPASTFMEVNRFIKPEWLIEVEADCIISD